MKVLVGDGKKFQEARAMPERVESNKKCGIIPLCPLHFSFLFKTYKKIRHPLLFSLDPPFCLTPVFMKNLKSPLFQLILGEFILHKIKRGGGGGSPPTQSTMNSTGESPPEPQIKNLVPKPHKVVSCSVKFITIHYQVFGL